jgi:hypothetical protein
LFKGIYMPFNTQLSDIAVNAQANALAVLCNGGSLSIYDGVQPANANSPITVDNTLGVVLTLPNPAFGAPNSGQISANSIDPSPAVGTITPTFGRITDTSGNTIIDVSAGMDQCNITIGAFTSGTLVSVTSFIHDVRNATTGY